MLYKQMCAARGGPGTEDSPHDRQRPEEEPLHCGWVVVGSLHFWLIKVKKPPLDLFALGLRIGMSSFLEFSDCNSYYTMTDHILLSCKLLPSLPLVFVPFPQQSPTRGLLFSPDF